MVSFTKMPVFGDHAIFRVRKVPARCPEQILHFCRNFVILKSGRIGNFDHFQTPIFEKTVFSVFRACSVFATKSAVFFPKWPKLALLINRVFARSECARSRQAFLHENVRNIRNGENGGFGQNRKNCQKWPKWPKSQKFQKPTTCEHFGNTRADLPPRTGRPESQKHEIVTHLVWHTQNALFY